MEETKMCRTVLVGWDGATFSVLNNLTQDGTMPFLAEFSAQGVRAVLRSTVHPLTAAAWPSLMTGVSPGQHGVYDFVKVDRREDRYTYVLSTSADLCSETIWSLAGRHGCRVTCLNFPSMFPPPQVPDTSIEKENGGHPFLAVIPGFVPHQYLPRAVQPSSLYGRIKAIPGFEARELALDWNLERKALQGLPQDEYESWIKFHTLRERHWFDILWMLLREEPCHLTAVLFDGVDKIQHLCYHLLDPRQRRQFDSPWANHIRKLCHEYFRQLDEFLECIAGQVGPEGRIFIASDHGFTSAGSHIFYANVWLEQHGYLRWADGVPLDQDRRLTLDSHSGVDTMFDWSGTTAFALTPSSNAIHIRRAKNSGPGVPEAEYEAFRQELANSLLAFKDDLGLPVVEAILIREEAFPGKQILDAPDLTLILRDRSFLSVLCADAPLKPRIAPYGTHHPNGIFFARGHGIRAGVELPTAPIVDVAPTLLYSLGLAIPDDMEGKVQTGAFEQSLLESRPIRTEKTTGSPKRPISKNDTVTVDEDFRKEAIDRLKALSYL